MFWNRKQPKHEIELWKCTQVLKGFFQLITDLRRGKTCNLQLILIVSIVLNILIILIILIILLISIILIVLLILIILIILIMLVILIILIILIIFYYTSYPYECQLITD